MPYGNKSQTLQARLQQSPSSSMYREPDEIVGSKSWICVKNATRNAQCYNASTEQNHFFDGMSHEEKTDYINNIPQKFINPKFSQNMNELDNINFWTDENGWQYIEGGEFNGKWVNPNYPNIMFNGRTITLPVSSTSSETSEFPVSSFEEDPKGIALRVTTNNTSMVVLPNKWTRYDDTRCGRKHIRHSRMYERRHSRWEQFDNANKIKNPIERQEVIAGLKMEFQSEDIEKDQKNMGYTDEEIAFAN
jgi:hypothetical protein